MPPVHLPTRVEAVTLYRSGARVRRVAELGAIGEDGVAELSLGNLPLALDDASCRIVLENAPELRATSLRIGLEVVAGVSGETPPDEAALERARVEATVLRSRLEALARTKQRVLSMGFTERYALEHELPPPSPTEARLALSSLRRDEVARLEAAIAELEPRAREAERLRKELESRRDRASSAREARPSELRKCALVGLAGRPTPGARFAIEYQVPGARWVPAYTLRLDASMKELELGMRALVAQKTGEDWTGATLVLSTAAPETWADLPDLPALRIGRRQPPTPKKGFREAPVGVDSLFADYDRSFVAKSPKDRGGRPVAKSAHPAMYAMADEAVSAGPPSAPVPPPRAFPGGAPMPVAAAAAPAPAMPLPPPSVAFSAAPSPQGPPMARSRSLFGGVGGGPPIVQALLDESLASPVGPELPETLEAERDLLDFGRLRMPAIEDARRGRPTRLDDRDVYLAFLEATRIELKVDVMNAIYVAIDDAEAVGALPVPAGHAIPMGETGFDYAYEAEAPVDVVSDGAFHSVPVALRTGRASPSFVVVPRKSTDVFRILRFANPLPGPLLDGPVDVYVSGAFLVTSRFGVVPTEGRVELGLGVEQAIKVARNTRFREETEGLLRGKLALVHGIRIEVSNQRAEAAALEVRERLPLPAEGEDELTVDVAKVEPRWEDFREPDSALEGGKVWRLEVPPHESRTCSVDYVVRISSKRELVGGNRREGV